MVGEDDEGYFCVVEYGEFVCFFEDVVVVFGEGDLLVDFVFNVF